MRKSKLMTAVFAAAMAVSVMAGMTVTSFAEEAEKVVTLGDPYEPTTLDPAQTTDDASYNVVTLIVEPLLRCVNGEAQPGAAESYEASDDLKEYTFHLREDNCYSDGTPITAADFVYSIQRGLDPDKGYANANGYYLIKNGQAYNSGEASVEDLGVEAVDDYTLKISTEYPAYPMNFASYIYAPINQAAAEEYDIAYGAEAGNLLTSGPFTVTDWTHDSEVTLEKNDNYWNADAVKLDKVIFKINATNDTAVDMMLAGELDEGKVGQMTQVNTLTDAGFESVTSYSGVQCLHINHAGQSEETGLFLGNTNFRKALNYALDRNALQAAAFTTDIATTRVIAPTESGAEDTFQNEYPYEGWSAGADPEKAQEYLQKALDELGKTADEIPTFSMLCYDSNNNMIALNAIMDMWSKTLGVTCTIDAQPIQNMLQKVYTYDYDFWKGGLDISGIDSLDIFGYYESESGLFNYRNDEYDALYDAALNAPDWKERKDDMFKLEQIACDDVVDFFITWPAFYSVYSPKITGAGRGLLNTFDVTYADVAE